MRRKKGCTWHGENQIKPRSSYPQSLLRGILQAVFYFENLSVLNAPPSTAGSLLSSTGKLPFPRPLSFIPHSSPELAAGYSAVRKKTKVVFAITKGTWGGAQRYVYTLATSLTGNSYDVCVCGGSPGTLFERLSAAGIRTISFQSLTRDVAILADLKTFIELLRLLIYEKPDILHLNSSKMGILGGLSGRITRVPKIIFTAHGWAHEESRPRLTRAILKRIHLLTIALSHKTIAVSEHVRRQMGTHGVSKKITVIHNGIAPIQFFKKEAARTYLGSCANTSFEKTAYLIGTIGELHKNKGLEYALEAVEHLPKDLSLCIVGDGEERKSLEKMVRIRRLSERVFFAGFIPEASRYLRAFDVFIMSSVKEGFPYVLLEVGLSGVPVIATNVGGIPEVIDGAHTGILVPTKNARALAHAIISLRNSGQGKKLRSALVEKIHADFSEDMMLKKTMALYAS